MKVKKALLSLAFVIVLMILNIYMNSKEKSEYESTTGQITYLDKQLNGWPVRDHGKYRYLQIEGYAYPFEIFIGKETGDLKPEFEQVDGLKPGDKITVFYYETDNTTTEGLNRFIQYIDKGNEQYFKRGNSARLLGTIIISLCVLSGVGVIVLWKMKKIDF